MRQFIDSDNLHLASIPFKTLERKMVWQKFPEFVTKIQLKYNHQDQCDGMLQKFKYVQVNFSILQVAIITGKNHILKMLMNHKKNPAKIEDFIKYVDSPGTSSNGIARTWISAANAMHLAARFNPEALYSILDKFLNNRDSWNQQKKKKFWEKASERDGFSPLHNAVTRPDAVSTRYVINYILD